MAKIQGIAEEFFPLGRPGLAAPEQIAGPGVVQAGQHSQQRGLAGAVRPLDTGDRTGQYGERQVTEQDPFIPLALQIDSL